MNRDEIMNILPHRDRMLLVDSVSLTEDGLALGQYAVRGDEWFLQGHFPGNPVVPGVVLCEIIAQTACVLMKDDLAGKTAYYAGMDKVRFRKIVRPGDVISIQACLLRKKLNVFVISGEASVDGAICAGGEFSFIIP